MNKDYTDRQLYEAKIAHGGYCQAGRALGIPEWVLRRRLKHYCPALPAYAYVPSAAVLPATHTDVAAVVDKSMPGKLRRFIVTSAQNNTPVHPGFLQNLKALAAHVRADLLISYTLYDKTGYRGILREPRVPTGHQDIWWDKATKPYVCNTRTILHPRLTLCGELDILASVARPLASLESYCGQSSIIVPHNRFAFQCVANRRHQLPKEMHTTGSVTMPRFVQRKTGQLAEFHHVMGALLVEISRDGYFYVHHLNAEANGNFYWLDKRVQDGVVWSYLAHERPPGLILGDIHAEKMGRPILATTRSMIRTLRPKTILLHDLFDCRSRNYHTRQNALFNVAVAERHQTVQQDLQSAVHFLLQLRKTTQAQFQVVPSNHDEALKQWILETDWRQDPSNAETYLTLALALVREQRRKPLDAASRLQVLPIALRAQGFSDPKCQFLKIDESYEICGIECGIHGHIGPSGSRGSPHNLSKLGVKTFAGHTHTPSIVDGCYTVGVTGMLDMEYNIGPSKWMHAHGIIYPNGKRAFIFIKGGRWRAHGARSLEHLESTNANGTTGKKPAT